MEKTDSGPPRTSRSRKKGGETTGNRVESHQVEQKHTSTYCMRHGRSGRAPLHASPTICEVAAGPGSVSSSALRGNRRGASAALPAAAETSPARRSARRPSKQSAARRRTAAARSGDREIQVARWRSVRERRVPVGEGGRQGRKGFGRQRSSPPGEEGEPATSASIFARSLVRGVAASAAAGALAGRRETRLSEDARMASRIMSSTALRVVRSLPAMRATASCPSRRAVLSEASRIGPRGQNSAAASPRVRTSSGLHRAGSCLSATRGGNARAAPSAARAGMPSRASDGCRSDECGACPPRSSSFVWDCCTMVP